LRIRVLDQPGQEVMLADARVSPLKYPQIVKYVIARRQGESLNSRFVSVLETHHHSPYIKSVRRVGDALEIARVGGERDVVLYNPQHAQQGAGDFKTDAAAMAATLDANGRLTRLFFAGGSYVEYQDWRFETAKLTGHVAAVDAPHAQVRIKLDPGQQVDPQSLVGRVVHFINPIRRTAHTIKTATLKEDELTLTMRDELLVGLVRIDKVSPNELTSQTAMPLDRTYRGATVANADFSFARRVRSVGGGKIELAEPLPLENPFKAGEDVWLVNVGAGEDFVVPGSFHWQARQR
jgi:hypothetical protein